MSDPVAVSIRGAMIKGRLNSTRGWLNSVLPHLAPEMMEWAPAEGMRTIESQLGEILAVEAFLVPWLRDGRRLTDPEIAEMLGGWPGSLDEYKQALVDVRASTLGYLDSLSDDELSGEVDCGEAWFGTFWRPRLPRAEHFLNISEHEFYHVGQLISYVWFRGDDPYKW